MTRLMKILAMGLTPHDANLFEGGGKGGAPAPIVTPPPQAPAPTEAATMVEADMTEEEELGKKEAKTQGAKSLQIPLGGDVTTTPVGTV